MTFPRIAKKRKYMYLKKLNKIKEQNVTGKKQWFRARPESKPQLFPIFARAQIGYHNDDFLTKHVAHVGDNTGPA